MSEHTLILLIGLWGRYCPDIFEKAKADFCTMLLDNYLDSAILRTWSLASCSKEEILKNLKDRSKHFDQNYRCRNWTSLLVTSTFYCWYFVALASTIKCKPGWSVYFVIFVITQEITHLYLHQVLLTPLNWVYLTYFLCICHSSLCSEADIIFFSLNLILGSKSTCITWFMLYYKHLKIHLLLWCFSIFFQPTQQQTRSRRFLGESADNEGTP